MANVCAHTRQSHAGRGCGEFLGAPSGPARLARLAPESPHTAPLRKSGRGRIDGTGDPLKASFNSSRWSRAGASAAHPASSASPPTHGSAAVGASPAAASRRTSRLSSAPTQKHVWRPRPQTREARAAAHACSQLPVFQKPHATRAADVLSDKRPL